MDVSVYSKVCRCTNDFVAVAATSFMRNRSRERRFGGPLRSEQAAIPSGTKQSLRTISCFLHHRFANYFRDVDSIVSEEKRRVGEKMEVFFFTSLEKQ